MYLNVLKVIFILIFTVFIYFNISFYISEKFKNNVELSRKNYDKFIKSFSTNLTLVSSKLDYKKFVDNSEYFKKIEKQPKFWDLLK